MGFERIDPQALKERLLSGEELALIDVREEGVFGARHILRAVNIPLSRIELDFTRRVPRRSVPLVLVDDNDGLAERAHGALNLCGHQDALILDGGNDAWEAAGFELFSGLNVPSKLFGEVVEHRDGTPNISAEDLKARLDSGDPTIILDSRPMDEYHAMNIPTGTDCPGAELVMRVKDMAPDPSVPVVVNCAGRTRSIIGAQSLVNAGLENPVYCLKNGTMGWYLAGFKLERGAERVAPSPSQKAKTWGRAAADRVAARFGVTKALWSQVEVWRAERDRTTYLFDVRDREAYLAGHIPGAAHAPGGQLVQATDEYIGILNARVVVYDEDEVQAVMTASWLIQMGWKDVYVLAGGVGTMGSEQGSDEIRVPELDMLTAQTVSVADIGKYPDAPIIDFSPSRKHRAGHPPGARFAIRSRVKADLTSLYRGELMLFIAEDERIAHLASHDLIRSGIHRIRVVKGGMPAWRTAGLPLETGIKNPLSEIEDNFYKPYDRENGVEEAMKAYLDWEIELLNRVERDGTLTFPEFPAA